MKNLKFEEFFHFVTQKKNFFFKVIFVFVLLSFLAFASQEIKPPSPSPSPSFSVLNSSRLLREYVRAQKAELKALDHQNKLDLKELKAAQDIQRKDWEKAEKLARHQFFEEHPHGKERRAYIQNFLTRKEALYRSFQDVKQRRVEEQEEKVRDLRQTQALNLQIFTKTLEQGQEPPADLWPKAQGGS